MPRQFPTLEDVSLPNVQGARPVAAIDPSGFGRGAQALAKGVQTLGTDVQQSAGDIVQGNIELDKKKVENGLMDLSTSYIKNRNQYSLSNDPADLDNWRKANTDAQTRFEAAVPAPNTYMGQHARGRMGIMAGEEDYRINERGHALATSGAEADTLQDIENLRNTTTPASLDASGRPDVTREMQLQGVHARIDQRLANGHLTPEKAQVYKQHAATTYAESEIRAVISAANAEPDPDKAQQYFKLAAHMMGRSVRGGGQPAIAGLSPAADVWANDNRAALQQQGIPVTVTSGFRDAAHNAAVGGARGSQHLDGKAIDVSLTGLTPQQQKQVVSQFLSDPRTGGFGYYQNSNSIHVDVRQGDKAAWGADYHGTSVGKGWPSWLTSQVTAWQGSQRGAPSAQPAVLGGGSAAEGSTSALPAVGAPGVQPSIAPGSEPWPPHPIAPLVQTALRPEQMDALSRMIEVGRHAKEIDQTRMWAAQEKARKDAFQDLEDRVFVSSQLDPLHPPLTPAHVSDMIVSGQIHAEDGQKLLSMQERIIKEQGDGDDKKYGPGFWDAYNRVHARDEDSSKITDADEIYRMAGPGQGLTMVGAKELVSQFRATNKPEDVAENAMKRQFLDWAKHEVSGEHGLLKMKDPKGEEIFTKFMQAFFPAYEKGRKEGKAPGELLDTEKGDLAKMLKAMKRPMPEWMSDVINDSPEMATGAAGAPAAPAGKFDPAQVKTVSELQAAYMAGKIDRTTASQIAIERGWAARRAPAAPSEPEPRGPPQSMPEAPPLDHGAHSEWRDGPLPVIGPPGQDPGNPRGAPLPYGR